MCEANVYILRDGKEDLLMERVSSIVPMKDGRLYLMDLSGEQKFINARIQRVMLIDHKIILEYTHEPAAYKRE